MFFLGDIMAEFLEWFNVFKYVLAPLGSVLNNILKLFFDDIVIFGVPIGYFFITIAFISVFVIALLNKGDQ